MNNTLLWKMLEGQVIENKYYLRELLGAGGFGGVFLADDVVRNKLMRQVAIKLIVADDNNQAQLNELQASMSLKHPNLISCSYVNECHLNAADFLYLVMEVAEFSLEKQLTERVLSEKETLQLVKDIAGALDYLHNEQNSIAHRDLKPGNILRVGDKWKLSDFGLVRAIGKNSVMDTVNLTGTPGYSPPEAYEGKVATSWDVWSLGVIIVQVLTGKMPFEGDTPQQLQKQVCNGEPDLSGLPKSFEQMVRGCLQKNRQKRWSVKQILTEVEYTFSNDSKTTKLSPQTQIFTRIVDSSTLVELPINPVNEGEDTSSNHPKLTESSPQNQEIHPDRWGRAKGFWGWFSSLFDDNSF